MLNQQMAFTKRSTLELFYFIPPLFITHSLSLSSLSVSFSFLFVLPLSLFMFLIPHLLYVNFHKKKKNVPHYSPAKAPRFL